MFVIKSLNLALRFVLELCALAALTYWGYRAGTGSITKIGLGAGIPLFTAIIWATFGAPGSSMELPEPLRFVLEFIIFGMAAVSIIASGHTNLARTFILLVIINRVLMFFWKQ
ncbi:YrdB family protein [Bacillus methanolicus]|uniref:Putative membrane protein n=1 Tax=Bacillus methanolicus (strain MGA3 / ATCC 53907) TaxID=796606 RepID=I3E8K9_BACMM|nr:YrdB family protein [Bacillus methanolicus]AIE60102.1 putative membrane protein [Bacillus methanolicus MGA3]EIJ82830.1 hypothetical protein MGA3_06380 [Bacillus methanolicus MGA3]UQD52099.1 DUF2568 domain-containing protein [Bacillus methanolicus]